MQLEFEFMNDDTFRLCYVELPWVFFTTQPLKDQWGDDWDDAPYEHNAGFPYYYGDHHKNSGVLPWEIKKVALDGHQWELREPKDGHYNSPYSVEQINKGLTPWLKSVEWSDKNVQIYAGTTYDEFIKIMKELDIDIYIKKG